MFRSSMSSSSGSSLFTSLSILLILKLLKHLKSIIIHRVYVAAYYKVRPCAYAATYFCNGVRIQGGSGRVLI